MKNHKTIGFASNTGTDLLKNHKVTKPALNVGPSLVQEQNAIYVNGVWLAGRCWPAYGGIWIISPFIN